MVAILKSFGHHPSLFVNTGGGYPFHWLFTEPVIDPAEVDPLLKRFGLTLMTGADKLGFRINHVFKAARLMRLPGTSNCKPGLDRPFVGYKAYGYRYSPTDFADLLLPLRRGAQALAHT